jgi:hypothetical protein
MNWRPWEELLKERPPATAIARLPYYRWMVVGTVCIGAFMGQLDASIAQLIGEKTCLGSLPADCLFSRARSPWQPHSSSQPPPHTGTWKRAIKAKRLTPRTRLYLTDEGWSREQCLNRFGTGQGAPFQPLPQVGGSPAFSCPRPAGARATPLHGPCPGGVCASPRRIAGCATPTSSAGHAPAGATANPKLTFKPDYHSGPGQAPGSGSSSIMRESRVTLRLGESVGRLEVVDTEAGERVRLHLDSGVSSLDGADRPTRAHHRPPAVVGGPHQRIPRRRLLVPHRRQSQSVPRRRDENGCFAELRCAVLRGHHAIVSLPYVQSCSTPRSVRRAELGRVV